MKHLQQSGVQHPYDTQPILKTVITFGFLKVDVNWNKNARLPR